MIKGVLRYDPRVQFRFRTALADVDVAGSTLPAGATVLLAMAAANRDPSVFVDPHEFRPGRTAKPHLTAGSGVHFCFGAPLDRLEVQIAMEALVRRLDNSRLASPPTYGFSPETRGPATLLIEVDGIGPR